ncbi:Superfamily II DNA or RNA helicase, SNF2 family [Chitinophaga jiangningensis]|uniref:Superfamily II DNA or RNA helicase, SNF2 family n=1 Tax=Chitinophaga jiangningensis TaxID=1419482 RepID=A0A1M6Y4M1_9BACT|nr:DEAD/DEAH box helicase [Chitinophaga jiangningensis]SHL13083.1 Superfamily II DNA or RNA helicase, SNF2 family [Chitinophaga jiangningensis]
MFEDPHFSRQYDHLSPNLRIMTDVLAIYMYPIDKPTLNAAMATLLPLQPVVVGEMLQQLADIGIVVKNVSGSFLLPLEYCLQLFPAVIMQPHYQDMLRAVPANDFHFYSTHAALQEMQRILVAYFIGDRSLLQLPVRKMEQNLTEYLPYLSCLAGRTAYKGILHFFSENAVAAMFSWSLRFQEQLMQPITVLKELQEELTPFSTVRICPEVSLLDGSLAAIPSPETTDEHFQQAVWLLYHDTSAKARQMFELGIKKQRSTDKKNTLPTTAIYAFYYACCLALLPPADSSPLIQKITTHYERKPFPAIVPALALLYLHMGKRERAENLLEILFENAAREADKRLMALLGYLALRWYHPKNKLLVLHQTSRRVLLARAVANGYGLPAFEYCYHTRDENYDGYQSFYDEFAATTGLKPLGASADQVPEWERVLNSLLGHEEKKREKAAVPYRIAYLLDLQQYTIQPVLQQFKDEVWSSGRPLPLSRLKDGSAEGMTDQDLRIGTAIQKVSYYNTGSDGWSFEPRVWQEMAGHPLLFDINNGAPVEVVKGVPEINVITNAKGYTISTNIHDFNTPMIFIRESNTRLKVIVLNTWQQHLLRTLHQLHTIPLTGKDKLNAVLQQVATHLTVHADMLETPTDIRSITADARIVVQLLPVNTGLKAAFFVKPFRNDPPYCKPGLGGRAVLGIMNGERCQARRNLDQELANYKELLGYIQLEVMQEVDDDQIIFEDAMDCLQLLEVIRLHPDIAVAEWPEGERYRIRQELDASQLHITIKEKDHWFTADGSIRVDEYTVLTLKELLDTNRLKHNRFYTLKNGEIVSLTDGIRRRLQELATFTMEEKDQLRIRPMIVPFASEALMDLEAVKTDTAWRNMLKKWEQAKELKVEVPAGLQTSLRSYQEEGFRWMVQLASWGAGACLADDMGLGKTIQALALLLHRAPQGPALVVCPASVLPNWISEANKFAPALNVVDLSSVNRAAIIKEATTFTVVVTTYGLLHSEAQLLHKKVWHTVVLDEAHIIRNAGTRTAKAAYGLDAHFRLALTGTPVQNNLGEIWGLFRFLNEELLGSQEYFNKQYVFPSLRNPESPVKKQLKKLLSPFMLRRTKTAVLEELPPSTEIVKLVQQTPEEAALYEAVRRKALESLHTREDNIGQRHIKALAEITRLRLAACNPKLIDSNMDIPSSKLEVFMEIVEELLQNQHKALVFSQFVMHLDLIKAALLQKGVKFLYLDGSTPVATRASLVKQFQSGAADVFLISLKAGGLGLNLTAADYVIHLDPWWNPAIEEQASDRARRIGQTRPVTVYRLVTMHTIEEKILTLHHTKRALADQLLEGTDQSVKLSAEELVQLIESY